MKLNKWLKELDLTWYNLPGNYVSKFSLKMKLKHRWYKIKRGFCFAFSSLEDKASEYNNIFEGQAFDIRNKEDKEGFCEYEFFSLDYSMALYIYPRLCEFKERYAKYGTPSSFCIDENGNEIHGEEPHEKWIAELDKMILAFRNIIKEPDCPEGQDYADFWRELNAIEEAGLESFAKYYRCLWW